jgi:tyrosyl-tRNA synthetase
MLMLKSTLRFYLLDKETIDNLIEEHKVAPHLRVLQRKLAEELTILFIRKKDWKSD